MIYKLLYINQTFKLACSLTFCFSLSSSVSAVQKCVQQRFDKAFTLWKKFIVSCVYVATFGIQKKDVWKKRCVCIFRFASQKSFVLHLSFGIQKKKMCESRYASQKRTSDIFHIKNFVWDLVGGKLRKNSNPNNCILFSTPLFVSCFVYCWTEQQQNQQNKLIGQITFCAFAFIIVYIRQILSASDIHKGPPLMIFF